LLYVFIITFVCFPGVSFDTSLKMLAGLDSAQSWFIVILNTIFSIADTIGRKMGGMKAFDLEASGIKILSVLRTLFIGTFYLIAFDVQPSWLFPSDWFKITNIFLFAFTNGYASTLCACKAPGTVPPDERGQVGGFIGTTITFGILIGSIIAFAETPILKLTPGFGT